MAVHQDGRWWRNYRCATSRAIGRVLDRNCAGVGAVAGSAGARDDLPSAGPAVAGRVRCGNGRRPDSRVGEATGPSAHLRRCGHRTRRDPRRGCRLCFGHGVDSGPRRAARGNRCCGFNARTTRIAVQQHRPSATRDSASLRAAGGDADLSQLAGRTPRLLANHLRHEHDADRGLALLARWNDRFCAGPTQTCDPHTSWPRGGATPMVQHAGPAVKTSSPRLPPRDAHHPVGGIRWLAVRITAVGSAHRRLCFHSGLGTRTQSPLGLLRAGPVGCYGPIRLGGLPDARNASGRILCFGHSQRSKHATTGEATAWLLEV